MQAEDAERLSDLVRLPTGDTALGLVTDPDLPVAAIPRQNER